MRYLDVSELVVSHDMGYDVTICRDISCDITPDHPKAPSKNNFNENRPPRCGLRFALTTLPSSCLASCLAYFVVLLLPIRWTHHMTDRTTSKHQHCLLVARPDT